MRYRLVVDVIHKVREPWHLFFQPPTLRWAITDKVGAWVLEALRSAKTVAEIAHEIAAQTGSNFPAVLAEVSRFIKSVTRAGLVVEEPGSCLEDRCSLNQQTLRPLSLYLHLTERCNLQCTYCYAHPPGKDYGLGKDMPLVLARHALDQAKACGVREVIVTGGEPLCHPEALAVLERAADLGFHVVLLTNGLLIDAKLAKQLARCCHQVTVSLDSANPILHELQRGLRTHARVTQAISHLKAAGVPEVVVSGVLTRYNQHEPYLDFAEYCKKAGADRVSRQVYILQGDDRDERLRPDFHSLLLRWEQELEEAIARSPERGERAEVAWRDRCGAAYGVIALAADGTVYPCQGLMREEFAAGNIGDAPLEEIYVNAAVLNKVRAVTVTDIPGCADCEYRFICGGGCRALAYNVQRSITAPIPPEYCAFAQLVAEWNLWEAARQDLAIPAELTL